MNTKAIFAVLGFVALLLGVCMLGCTVWGLPCFKGGPEEARGCAALFYSAIICFVVGVVFFVLGRGYHTERLYLRDAFACVSLCWFLAIILGAIPYLLAHVERSEGVPFTVCDAIFESSSGLTTTGGTVFGDLETPETLPRTILFWRCLTHFLGGLGVVCLFVVFLGKGASGKAVLKVEHIFSGHLPFTKMRSLALSLGAIYLTICAACFFWYLVCGTSVYDAISHAFSIVALGGFGTHNDSVGFFESQPGVRYIALEYGTIFFTIVAGMNYWLLYWAARGSFGKLFRDGEWRLYILTFVVVSLLTAGLGLAQGSFVVENQTEASQASAAVESSPHVGILSAPENDDVANSQTISESAPYHDEVTVCKSYEEVLRKTCFHTASLMTGEGFSTARFECWSGAAILLFALVMFMGACSGTPTGGIKVSRALLILRALRREPEKRFRPNVVKSTKAGSLNVDVETEDSALRYAVFFAALIIVTAFVVCAIESNGLWSANAQPQTVKLYDVLGASLAMFANTGLALGVFGSTGNLGDLTGISKLIFSWAMVVGRLEIWCVLALLTRKFWSNR